MPRRTKKYIAACAAARYHKITKAGDSETLYQRLQEEGNLWWNVETQSWEEGEAAKPATSLVYVRVWSPSHSVENHASKVRELLQEEGYQVLEESKPYACRPPQQLESRIYLKLLPPGSPVGNRPKATDAVLGG